VDQSFFERTVEQTSAAYQRLEGNPVLNALFQGKCSLEDYRDILVLLYQFYSGFEYKLVQSGTGKLAGTLFYTHT
jgi:heme oxygenase